MRLWRADPHEYGPGKTHIIDDDVAGKTVCGRYLAAVPGKEVSPEEYSPSCLVCPDTLARRRDREAARKAWEKSEAERERARLEKDRQWHEWYEGYRSTPAWQSLRAKVMRRANGVCEGCGERPPSVVHHLSYANVGHEFLWELRAVCRQCHDRVHGHATTAAVRA